MEEDKTGLLKTLFGSDDSKEELSRLTERIIGGASRVANELGCGFLKKVYENALAYELKKNNLEVEQQKQSKVFYDKFEVGYYEADLVIENTVLVE